MVITKLNIHSRSCEVLHGSDKPSSWLMQFHFFFKKYTCWYFHQPFSPARAHIGKEASLTYVFNIKVENEVTELYGQLEMAQTAVMNNVV